MTTKIDDAVKRVTDNLEHSPLGPSAGKRWMNCTASVLFTKDMPDTTSVYAAEGTFGHNISEYCRNENVPAKKYIGHTETIDGHTFTCDAAFAEAIQVFLDYANTFDGDAFFELRVHYDYWVELGFGTSDDIRIGINKDEGICVITDLKMGKGVKEYATENVQLRLYGLGVLQELGHLYEIDTFQFNICQPRLDHIDEWTIPAREIIEWAEEVAKPQSIIAITGEGAEFKPGDWCRFCPGKLDCKARTDWVHNQMADEMDQVHDSNTMSNDDLGSAYANLAIIRAWCADIEEACLTKTQQGENVIGPDDLPLKMVVGRANRTWRDVAAAEKMMRASKKFKKVADMFTQKLIGVPAAEKVLGKKDESLLAEIIKPQGKAVLVLGSDPREAFKADADEMDDLDDDDTSFLDD